MQSIFNNKYQFKNIETKYNTHWNITKLYKWKNSGNNQFIIDTPPPTISGQLHIGHVFSYCHTDFIARYQRMLGKDVFYPIGFDDNGLPTERLVEKTKKIRATDMSRKEFNTICTQVSNEFRIQFKQLFQSIGISYDWDLEYHTISKNIQKISQTSFINLYNKGKLYRKLQPIFWDCIDKTAIARAEVEENEISSFMNTITFSTEAGIPINIATTRPELMPACVAVFFNPSDTRYQHLLGQNAIVPIFGNRVKILPDDQVKIDKGTGLVMCCTFGDEMDVYWWNKHNLDTKIIISKSGTIFNLSSDTTQGKSVCNQLHGLPITKARALILEILDQNNLLKHKQEIIHNVKCAERSGAPIEILLSHQWFIKVVEIKQELLKQVQKINWYPKSMRKQIEIWIEGLNWDWCISRQRYFGVPFPVWYSKKADGEIILPDINKLPVDPINDLPEGYQDTEVEADTDVMDTWATSSLSTQFHNISTTHADLRAQSHEIIRSWAFYTILQAYYHNNDIPWKNIMISGWCLAEDKTKMSKSKGNTLTPNKLLEEYGADVVRYWAANSKLGADTTFSNDVLKLGKRFTTKLWNASKFVSMFIGQYSEIDLQHVTETMDKWILSKLYKVIIKATESFNSFEYCIALNYIESFFWKDFCDNYLELSKKRAYGESTSKQEHLSAVHTLSFILRELLKMLAPFMPYITEEIYNTLYNNKNSIHSHNNWPIANISLYNASDELLGEDFIEILNQVRKIKANAQLSVKYKIDKLIINSQGCNFPTSLENDLKAVCNAEHIVYTTQPVIDTNEEKFLVSLEFTNQ
ncbi:valyl-tRNA synthetase [Ehrlichia chaffeensis str. Arkansas]|uniref:Valine--tRNA ligase n=1 Tax=Ehrlichia chaffeensis (strain ATCC CRL-10679 / Arkansas) TaxID=205920 RepID=Q2GHW9_EHRCR|nr:valine--tRNA ligase [Ehrlichia chaffeensis]ABD45291.1 valyl-tRNA synthetase [Ehrlichia chaffeensis str. Arkansas]AHX07218.1 valine--tRNA ligase [Ehrlichia chaffeensis str. Osceola]AHX08880.1 valine--tRNA ligase [Ehrlichia chaffeensis str. Saint Vincent]